MTPAPLNTPGASGFPPIRPTTQPDYLKGALQTFRTSGGLGFAARVIVPIAVLLTLLNMTVMPSYFSAMGGIMDVADDPDAFDMGDFGALMGWIAALTFGILFLAIPAAAAIHRKVIFDTEAPGIPLRFGRGEMNLLLTYLGVFGVLIGLFIAFILVVGILTGVSVGLSGGGSGGAIFAVVVIFFAYIAMIVGAVWLTIRLAPAGAATTLAGRPVVLGARTITKHRFWQTFAIYLIAYVMAAVVSAVFSLIGYSAIGASMMDVMVDPTALAGLQNVPFGSMLLFSAATALGSSIQIVWFAGVGAYIVRWYNHDANRTQVFD